MEYKPDTNYDSYSDDGNSENSLDPKKPGGAKAPKKNVEEGEVVDDDEA